MFNKTNKDLFIFLGLILFLFLGAYFRFVGIDWDKNYHLHPDERFLTMVETSIQPVDSLKEYFDTDNSQLNPHNVIDANGNQSFPFFVYGTFPISLVRYVGELLGKTGYSEIYLVGRYLSGIFDIGTIILVFFIGKELFNSKIAALFSSIFYTCATLPIQISHFFIVDHFTTFFTMLTFLMAVRIFNDERTRKYKQDPKSFSDYILRDWNGFGNYFVFSIALGLATASKVNAVVAALLLPAAIFFANLGEFKTITSGKMKVIIRNLFTAGVLSFLFFRIFQPYAFEGPSFLNISLNPKWINNLRELSALSSGLSNYPPSLQWTRRSVIFPIKNMLIWGMGLPFGLICLFSLFRMVNKTIHGQWKQYGLLLFWNLIYLIWQVMRWNPTMRYFLLIYPTLAISAGWFMNDFTFRMSSNGKKKKILSSVVITAILALSTLWAFAFVNIYKDPMTRIEASEWIYQNIEGPINLEINGEDSFFTQPIPYPKYFFLDAGKSLVIEFQPGLNESIKGITFDHIAVETSNDSKQNLSISIYREGSKDFLAHIEIAENFQATGDSRGQNWTFEFPQEILLSQDEDYILKISSTQHEGVLQFSGTINLIYQEDAYQFNKRIFEFSDPLQSNEEYSYSFTPIETGEVLGVEFFRVRSGIGNNKDLMIDVSIKDGSSKQILATGKNNIAASGFSDSRGANLSIKFDEAVQLLSDDTYEIAFSIEGDEDSSVFINGSKAAKETDWDDTLPLFMYGFNPFDNYAGIFQSDLNFQMYWDDNVDKLQRFVSILDQADYIIFSSNRQWGSVTQAQEKYPLSTSFYENLIGCEEANVQQCYINAQPSNSQGELGFYLDQVFQSNPHIFGLDFNSQNAEEAFTVYDHPKVFIFRKTEDFSYEEVKAKLLSVDGEKVLNISPQEVEARPGLLEMPQKQVNLQKIWGTWSELFDYQSIQNENQLISVLVWYLGISVIAWLMYPSLHIVFKGLDNNGWTLLRISGLIIIAFQVWIAGSFGIQINRALVGFCVLITVLINIFIFAKNRTEIIQELRQNRKSIIIIEVLTLTFFMLFLIVRVGNPDLWHPYKGGEKPMDFSYFNALIKSVNYPPYDPWYAGGYINYYYWGFLIAAIPTKLLGIVPSIAYNLILPSFFSFTAMAAYCLGVNLYGKNNIKEKLQEGNKQNRRKLFAGLITAVFVLIVGNLGTIKMIFQGFQRLGEITNLSDGNGFASPIIHLFEGIKVMIQGGKFNFYPGDWYWIPSRVIPGEPITEFPYFTFLYGDPHAHLFALPITLLTLCWAISLLFRKMQFLNKWNGILTLFAGALFVGALRPTNTWDYPVYLSITCVSILYAYLKNILPPKEIFPNLNINKKRVLIAVLIALGFGLLSYFLYYPFSKWYGQGYTSISLWEGNKTPIGSYFTHWGFFIFIIYSWLGKEVTHWMKTTPLSKLKKFIPFWRYIVIGLFLIFSGLILMLIQGVAISIIVIPALLIVAFLIFQPDFSENKRFILLLTGVGLTLSLIVEIVVLSGDIGRMNTVFKFYLQAWSCLAISAAWFVDDIFRNFHQIQTDNLKLGWKTAFRLLLFSVALFPLIATIDKVTDRISMNVPLTLDGMEFMQYSTYMENDQLMELSQDYELIRWMQNNVPGTPVILEANVPEYRWGNRITIYTGLPGVIGWNWHQRQQRAINPAEWVFTRVADVKTIYSTSDLSEALDLIEKYEVEYIVIGQLENAIYPEEGIQKFFEDINNNLDIVYASADTYLLQVVD